ncbi:MAG: bifunctional phosphoglucose/phosphomannose isomerase [Thermoplasmataceae archaeon]|jgi:glucose/mannose-6-phosphate isomerase
MIDELKSLRQQLLFSGKFDPPEFRNCVIAGMGGSGIAGRIFSDIYTKKPVICLSSYEIPDFVDSDTLFIGMSYSGNTEETIAAFREAERRGAQMAAITSGGALEKMCHRTVKIPQGLQPRSALGYLFVPLALSIILGAAEDLIEASNLVTEIDNDNSWIKTMADSMVDKGRIPVILGYPPFQSVAYRWQTQFNENSKLLSFNLTFPELDHNAIMALEKTYNKDSFVYYTLGGAQGRIKNRINFTLDLTSTENIEIPVKGKSIIAKTFYLTHIGDYISYYAALKRKVEPLDVTTIERLKGLLSKV